MTPPPADATRIEAIANLDPSRTFATAARAVVPTHTAPDRAHRVAERLATSLSTVSGRHHAVEAHIATDHSLHADALPTGTAIFADLQRRLSNTCSDGGLRRRNDGSRTLVATPAELASCWLPEGARLTPDGQRAVAPRPGESTALKRPPVGQLAPFRTDGLALGRPH
jgi:hypothetical protein